MVELEAVSEVPHQAQPVLLPWVLASERMEEVSVELLPAPLAQALSEEASVVLVEASEELPLVPHHLQLCLDVIVELFRFPLPHQLRQTPSRSLLSCDL